MFVSLTNKIFFKIGSVFSVIIILYILFMTFFIAPKITDYLVSLDKKQSKVQLDRISAIIASQENYLKEYYGYQVTKHRENIRNNSLMAYNILNSYYKRYKGGSLSKEKALDNAIKIISNIKSGLENNYTFLLDRKGNLIFHPDKRYHLKNMYTIKDSNGNSFVDKIIANSVKDEETYTRYFWTKLDSDIISEKIVHSLYYKPFDLIIATGTYLQNIKQEIEIEKEKVIRNLEPLIKSIVIENSGYIVLVNGEDKVVLHPDEKVINKEIFSNTEYGRNRLLVETFKDAYRNNKALEYKWNKPNDLKNFTYEKIAWINYNSFFDWYIVSTIYKSDLEKKAKDINKILINVSLIILFILGFMAILFLKRLLEPISMLSQNADLVKKGNLAIRNNINSSDEIGNLADHFDSMLDSIEENTKNLEYKIGRRTSELNHKLYYDKLTGLKNRESLRTDLKKQDFCALNLVELDGFDDIYELYGFDIGNEVLIEVTEILKEFSKKNGAGLYRLESDIFAILDTHMERIIKYDSFLEDIQEIFNKEVLVKSLGIELLIYIRTGTSISQSDSLKTAKIALKRAKENGLKYLVYNKSIDTKDNIKKTMYWRDKINDSINKDRVIPFFQAIFNKDGEIVKYETLMRIYDEIDGKGYYLSPGSFFDVAIKTKQYFKLNQTIIKKAFTMLDKIEKDISLNLSFIDIMNREFVHFIEKEIDNLSKEQRQKVVFEILESDNISDYQILDEFIFKYREKGIRFAIDDFGTGYSNFSHILKIKPDYIKIDGSLIKDINNDENSYQMVKAIVEFSKSLNITVIAEFIHSKEVYDIVRELDVDEYQGYFLGEPKPLV